MFLVQAAFILIFPWLVLKFTKLNPRLGFLSPILLCYLAGILIGNLAFLRVDPSLSMSLAEVAVPLAIPLVLFSTDIIKCLRLAKRTILSFILVIISGLVSSALGAFIFKSRVEEFGQIAGMLTGVYTGGTPNLMAIAMGLGVRQETIILVNTADVLWGGLYLLFLMVLAKPLLSKFLPPFTYQEEAAASEAIEEVQISIHFFKRKEKIKTIALVLVLSLAIVGVSSLLSFLITGELSIGLVILTITTLGIVGSLFKRIRTIAGTYEVGEYLLLIFSVALGTTVNFREMLSSSSTIFLYTGFVMTGAILLHYLLAGFFRIDVDTTIITSTAGIFGPPFIPPVAGILRNKEVIITGLTISLVGYAIGNYLGMFLAYLLM
jgi:uncharacterized membrane protein